MAEIQIFICSEFEKDIKDKAQEIMVENFKKQLRERTPEDARISLEMLNPPLYLKKLGGPMRIIIQEIQEQDRTFFCFRRILHTQSNEYDTIRKKPKKWLEENPFQEVLPKKEEIIPPTLPELPENLLKWRELAQKKCDLFNGSTVIYESQEWVEATNSTIFQDYWYAFFNLLQKIIKPQFPPEEAMEHDIQIARSEEDDIGFFYQKYHYGERCVYLLLEPFKNKPDEKKKKYYQKEYSVSHGSNIDNIISKARRGFPYYILADKDLWKEAEKEQTCANLALSKEEENLLKEVKFPLFINGKAGSGKSTILYYLFAQYCQRILSKNPLQPPPVFLTYTEKLLSSARNRIAYILKLNPNYADLYLKEEALYPFFMTFQEFLKSMLSEEEQKCFSEESYISFARFSDMYYKDCHLPEKKHYPSPEILWHTIRTFIKGYSPKSFLPPEEYAEISRKDRSVTLENYKEVYNIFWKRWYETLQGKYWDDQDLIRYVLEKNLAKPKYSVIFCDESQDFTRIELQVLMKSSEFLQYSLAKTDCLPYAFAGDPFQTINPTGFNWERLTSAFHEEIRKLGCKSISLKTENLTHNYRSDKRIVDFSNLVQYYRWYLLQEGTAKPQNAWFLYQKEQEEIEVSIFSLDDDKVKKTIQEKGDDAKQQTIIVPIEKEKIAEYIQKDDFLRQIVQKSENEQGNITFLNIYSCMDIKGLEFPKVILYKFGEHADRLFSELLEKRKREQDIQEQDESLFIRAAYFFNKLYVAATRPQNNIFIIDSAKGNSDFWHFFYKENALVEDKSNFWQNKLNFIKKGEIIEISAMFHTTEQDLIKTADTLRQSGEYQGNKEHLRKAQYYYQKTGKSKDAKECQALIYELSIDWLNAGKIYQDLDRYEDASRCFWQGYCWKELQQMPRKWNDMTPFIADFMISQDILQLGDSLKEAYQSNPLITNYIKIYDPVWIRVVETIVTCLRNLKLSKENTLKIAPILEGIAYLGFNNLKEEIAYIYFINREYRKSIVLWESLQKTNMPQYFEAKAWISENGIDKISYFLRAQKYQEAASCYLDMEQMLGEKNSDMIMSLLIFLESFSFPKKESLFEKLLKNLVQISQSSPEKKASWEMHWQKILQIWNQYLSKEGESWLKKTEFFPGEVKNFSLDLFINLFSLYFSTYKNKNSFVEQTEKLVSLCQKIASGRFWTQIVELWEEQKISEHRERILLPILQTIILNAAQNPLLWIQSLEMIFGSFETQLILLKNWQFFRQDTLKKGKEWPSAARNNEKFIREKLANKLQKLDEIWKNEEEKKHFCELVQKKDVMQRKQNGENIYDDSLIPSFKEVIDYLITEEDISSQIWSILQSQELREMISPMPVYEKCMCLLISKLAYAPRIKSAAIRKALRDFLLSRFLLWNEKDRFQNIPDSIFQKQYINFTEIGCAIEKVESTYKNQLAFYEEALYRLEKQGINDQEQSFWIQKRIICIRIKWSKTFPQDLAKELVYKNEEQRKLLGVTEEYLQQEFVAPIHMWDQKIRISITPELLGGINKRSDHQYYYFSLEDFDIQVRSNSCIQVDSRAIGTRDRFNISMGKIEFDSYWIQNPSLDNESELKKFSTTMYKGIMSSNSLELYFDKHTVKIHFSSI